MTNRLSFFVRKHTFKAITLTTMLAIGATLSASAEETPELHTVKKGPLANKVEFKGTFESRTMKEIRLEPKVVSELILQEVIDHGKRVSEGDTLLKLDLKELREQIEEATATHTAAGLTLAAAHDDLRQLERTTPLKLQAAERAWRIANEDYSYFVETDREVKETSARFMLKSSEQRLANAMEELTQLEQMYKEDDLTEETEEIILKRQRFTVEAAELSLKNSRLSTKRSLEVLIPRQHETLKSAKLDQDLTHAQAITSLPRALDQKRLATEKLTRDHEKAEEKLADLKKDRKRLTVTAPMDGVVYYGACVDGMWSTGAAVAKKLVPEGKLTANEVLLTVLDPDDLIVRISVPEDKVALLKKGQKASLSPVVAPDQKIEAKLESLSFLPAPGSTDFPAVLALKKPGDSRIMPGLSCKIVFGGESTKNVLTVPKQSVLKEGDKHFVFLPGEEDKPEKRAIKVGASDDKHYEVTEGLSEGDKILKIKP